MKKATQLIKFSQHKYITSIVVFILIVIVSHSSSLASNLDDQNCENSEIFSNLNREFLSISYNEKSVVLKSSLDSYIPVLNKVIDLNLYFNIGYDTDSLIKLNSINVKSLIFQTHINAIYCYENQELELSLSNSFLNDYLFDGMKLEFKTTPSRGSGAILFVMTL